MRKRFVVLGVASALLAVAFIRLQPRLFALQFDNTSHAPVPKFIAPAGLPNPNDIYMQVNRLRVSKGLPPLERNAELTKVAEARAADMTKNRYYAHKSPSGKYFFDLIRQDGYQISYGCENLDLEFTTIPSVYVTDWYNSTHGHRECMLNPTATEAGYAVAQLPPIAGADTPSYIVVTIQAQVPGN